MGAEAGVGRRERGGEGRKSNEREKRGSRLGNEMVGREGKARNKGKKSREWKGLDDGKRCVKRHE